MELRSDEDGDEAMEEDGVEVMIVGEVERKSLMSRERLKLEKGRDGRKCLGEAGVRDRLDLEAVLESRDSNRVTSLDTAMLRFSMDEAGG